MSEVFIGQGTVVSFSNDDFNLDNNTVDCITTITMPGPITEEVETTCIESTVKQYTSSRQKDYEDFSFEYNWDPNDTVHALLDTRQGSGEEQTWKVAIPPQGGQSSTTEITFKGFITGNAGSPFSATDVLARTCTVKVTSDLTISTTP